MFACKPMTDNTLHLILTIGALLLTIWLEWEKIKDRFRRWSKQTLEKGLLEIKAPDYIEKHRYFRDRDALIGFALIAAVTCLEAITFTAMYPIKIPFLVMARSRLRYSAHMLLSFFSTTRFHRINTLRRSTSKPGWLSSKKCTKNINSQQRHSLKDGGEYCCCL
jgi:hypothetical protein